MKLGFLSVAPKWRKQKLAIVFQYAAVVFSDIPKCNIMKKSEYFNPPGKSAVGSIELEDMKTSCLLVNLGDITYL